MYFLSLYFPGIFWSSSLDNKNLAGNLQITDSVREDQGKFECVAENSVGTEHSKPINLYIKERRVPPSFSRFPEPLNEVRLGANLSLECVAVGSPMPYVKWRSGAEDITPEDQIRVGKNVLNLTDIQTSANYTCVAASTLGKIEATAIVKVQCKFKHIRTNLKIGHTHTVCTCVVACDKCIYIFLDFRFSLPLRFVWPLDSCSFAGGTNRCHNIWSNGHFRASRMVIQRIRRSAVLCYTVQAEECESSELKFVFGYFCSFRRFFISAGNERKSQNLIKTQKMFLTFLPLFTGIQRD